MHDWAGGVHASPARPPMDSNTANARAAGHGAVVWRELRYGRFDIVVAAIERSGTVQIHASIAARDDGAFRQFTVQSDRGNANVGCDAAVQAICRLVDSLTQRAAAAEQKVASRRSGSGTVR